MSRYLLIPLLFLSFFYVGESKSQENTLWCERDCKMEYQFFKRYAKEGSSLASLSLAIMNYRGHGRDVDVSTANRLLLKAAREEEPVAMYQLGYFFMFGLYVEQDFTRAMMWLKRASNHRIGNAEQLVGLLENHLNGVKSDKDESAMKVLATKAVMAQQMYEQLPNNMPKNAVERITVVHSFDWSHALVIAKQQTCRINCDRRWGSMLFPRIKSTNEAALLEALN